MAGPEAEVAVVGAAHVAAPPARAVAEGAARPAVSEGLLQYISFQVEGLHIYESFLLLLRTSWIGRSVFILINIIYLAINVNRILLHFSDLINIYIFNNQQHEYFGLY